MLEVTSAPARLASPARRSVSWMMTPCTASADWTTGSRWTWRYQYWRGQTREEGKEEEEKTTAGAPPPPPGGGRGGGTRAFPTARGPTGRVTPRPPPPREPRTP